MNTIDKELLPMPSKYDAIKLENQLCFPLYACAKEVVRQYKPHLDQIDLTYTQYIIMMVMWEKSQLTVKELGQYVYLDSGTLTPVLKKLEAKGFISRSRSTDDERNVQIAITEKGNQLKEKAVEIPVQIGKCISLEEEEVKTLYGLLYKVLNNIT